MRVLTGISISLVALLFGSGCTTLDSIVDPEPERAQQWLGRGDAYGARQELEALTPPRAKQIRFLVAVLKYWQLGY